MLTDGRATGLATADDATVAIDQFLQEVNVLVIDIHRTWALAIDEQRILLFKCANEFANASVHGSWPSAVDAWLT